MTCFSLSHLSDHILLRNIATLVTQDRATTAALLAHIAEVDERRLYLPAACSSMYLYCVRELRMSEDTAFKRIRVARTARQFPPLFAALADGRLNLSSVLLLTPHLKPDTAHELIVAAAHKTNAEIELLLAERFPQPDMPTLVWAMSPAGATDERVDRPVTDPALQLAVRPVVPSDAPKSFVLMEPLAPRAKLAPLSPGRFALQLTVNQTTHDLLRYAQALLGHAVPSGDVAEVIERALRELVRKLEQQKFAATARARPEPSSGRVPRSTANGRYVPADVRRTVWQRDGGQCTFVSDHGIRCDARTRLEFDHVKLVARGGQTTIAGMRLRCRAHNQYTAECTFGAGFMREKRQEAGCKAAKVKARTGAEAEETAKAQALVQTKAQDLAQSPACTEAAAEVARAQDVTPWLRQLGCSPQEARRGAAYCAHIPDAQLEQRVRVALQGVAPHRVRRAAHVVSNVP